MHDRRLRKTCRPKSLGSTPSMCASGMRNSLFNDHRSLRFSSWFLKILKTVFEIGFFAISKRFCSFNRRIVIPDV